MTPEGTVKKKLKKDLSNSFQWWVALSDRYTSGLPDFLCVRQGLTYAYETKAPGKDLTRLQKSIAKKMMSVGVEYLVVSMDKDRKLTFRKP